MSPPNLSELESQLSKLDLKTLKTIDLLTSERRKFSYASTAVSTLLALVAGVASAGVELFPKANIEAIAIASVLFGAITYFFALRERKKEQDVLIETFLKKLEKSISNRENAAASAQEKLEIIRNISKGDA